MTEMSASEKLNHCSGVWTEITLSRQSILNIKLSYEGQKALSYLEKCLEFRQRFFIIA